MKNKPYKRFLAFLLCAAMLITYMPSTAFTFAAGSEGTSEIEESDTSSKDATNEKAEGESSEKDKSGEEVKSEKSEKVVPDNEAKGDSPDSGTSDDGANIGSSDGDAAGDGAKGSDTSETPVLQNVNDAGENSGNTNETPDGDQNDETPAFGEDVFDANAPSGEGQAKSVQSDEQLSGEESVDEKTRDAEVTKYTVKFISDGSEVAEVEVVENESVGEANMPDDPTKEGYKFTGWFYNDGNGEKKEFKKDTAVNDNITATAEFERVYTVTFYNRDAEAIKTVTVKQGDAIGELPATIPREDYTAYWAVGEIVQGGQGKEINVLGPRINSTYVPTDDTVIVPDYDKITYTITFYDDENKTTQLYTKTVTADTSYCLNDIPDVPKKDGHSSKWVYAEGDFNNKVAVSADTDVWVKYEATEFTVTYKYQIDDVETKYQEDKYYKGDSLVLPSDPVEEGYEFLGWYDGETQYTDGKPVNSDLVLQGKFKDMYSVKFIVDEGDVKETLSQYFRTQGEKINTMPEQPFVAGKKFVKWVKQGSDPEVEVTADTTVDESFVAVAVFESIETYTIKAHYYYMNDSNNKITFDTAITEVTIEELPYTITPPSQTQTDPDEVATGPVYYPKETPVVITEANFGTGKTYEFEIEYVPFTAKYDFVYLLKDLTGDTYSEIDRTSDVEGVLGSFVTPTVKTFDYATLELAEGATIETTGMDGQPKQELPVYYSRKSFQLSYETSGGSYVPGTSAPYGSEVTLSSTVPTRDGYTFAGWYLDEDLTQAAGSTVELTKDTIVYAKWTGKDVKYTIVYMIEEYDNASGTTSFVYDNSREATGQVGTTVYASSAPDLTGNNYRGYERDTAFDQTSSVTIAADGSSVLVVHYKLIRYTFVFNLSNNNGRIEIGGQTYTGSNYRIENVVLGQDLGSKWPSTPDEVYTTTGTQYFSGWGGGPFRFLTKRYEVVWQMVQNANNSHVMTFTANWENTPSYRRVEYWLQQPDGSYEIDEQFSQTFYYSAQIGFGAKAIDGYTEHNGTPSGYQGSGNDNSTIGSVTQSNNGNYVRDDNKIGGNNLTYYEFEGHLYRQRRNSGDGSLTRYNVTFMYVYRYYFDRAKYDIEYYFGSTNLRTIENVFFEADISGDNFNYTPAKPANTETIDYSDYTWGGWYEDSALQNKFVFANATMPGHNLKLYAKWIAPQYTVKFVDDDGTTELAATQTVDKYKKAEQPAAPTKDGYTFEGWFTTKDGNERFDWETQIIANTTVYAHWTREPLSYTVYYLKDSEEGDELAPSKTVTNPNFKPDDEITESALTISGYRPDQGEKTVKLEVGKDNVIKFIYTVKSGKIGYTVRHILAGTEGEANPVKVHDDEPFTADQDTLAVIAYAVNATYDGVELYPDATEKQFTLGTDESSNVITFLYSKYKSIKVTVNYVDMDGTALFDQFTKTLKRGNEFTLAHTPIAGWELSKAVVGTSYNGDEAGDSLKITDEVIQNYPDGIVFTLFYQKKVTITANSFNQQYDGTELKLPEALDEQITIDAEGLTIDDLKSIDFTYVGADNDTNDGRLNAGVATVTPKDAVFKQQHSANYYAVHYISGTLEVTPINVTVRIEPDRWTGAVYNGEPYLVGFTNPSKDVEDYILISHEGYAETYLDDIWDAIKNLDGVTQGGVGLGYYVVSKTDAGDYDYDLGFTESNLPENNNYSVSLYVRKGRIQILPQELTVTTGSDSKPYDGEPLTCAEASLAGLVEADEGKVTVTATGTITDPGTETNSYEIAWGDVNPNNYKINEDLGTLEVTCQIIVDPVAAKTRFATKVASGDGFADKTFSFTLTPVTEGAPMPESGTTGNATVTTTAKSQPVSFGKIKYTKIGTYTYTVTETTESGNGWTCDTAPKTVTVSITDDDEDFVLEATVTGAEITNSYKPTPIIVDDKDAQGNAIATKTASGEEFASKEFSFTLAAVTEGAPMPEGGATGKATVTTTAKSQTVDFGAIEYTAAGTYNYTVTETTASGDGWTCDNDAHDVTVTVESNNGQLTATVSGATIANSYTDPGPEPPTPVPNLHMTIKKETTSTPANGETYALGETITYKITATNDGEATLTNVTVEDELTGDTWPIESLAVGASEEFTAQYVVKEADILAGKVVNNATAKGDGDPTVTPGTTEDPTEKPDPKLEVDKKASPSKNAKEGTVITYTVTVKNTGNVTVSNITIDDTLVNVNVDPFDLAPGATRRITYKYTVTAADVENGSVSNTATATGTNPSDVDTTPGKDTVVVTTEEEEEEDDTPTPTPPAPAGPAGPAPGGPGVVPAAPADGTPIADDAVPQAEPEAEPEVEIPDEATPLAAGTWAVLNLVAAILTTLGAVVALFRKKEEEDEDEDDQNKPKTDEDDEDDNRGKKMLAAKIAGAVAGVAAPITFFLTEDMTQNMALTDKWTLLMVVFLAAQVVTAVLNKKASELDDEEETAEEGTN